MKRIALVGESPNDTGAIAALLRRKYGDQNEFFALIERERGGNLDNVKPTSVTLKTLKFEYNYHKPDFVIYCRDLDGLEADVAAYTTKLEAMYALAKAIAHNSVFLLCIYEMESLLLADLGPLNAKFGTSLVYPDLANNPPDPPDVMLLRDTKGYLMSRCTYKPSDCPELFAKLDFDKLLSVRFFAEFIEQLEKRL